MGTKGTIRVLLAAAAIIGAGFIADGWDSTSAERITYRYEMEAGDTVYEVAARVATPRENINRLAWQILKDNHIQDPGAVQPGTILTIRVDPASRVLHHDN